MDSYVADDELKLADMLGARSRSRARRALLSQLKRSLGERGGGSRRGRLSNRKRGFDMGAHAISRDSFGVDGERPVYGEGDFERRFRMPRPVFNRLFRAIHDQPYRRSSINATGRPQAHAIQKVSGALRVLGYGEPFDLPDEYCRLSRSTIDEATRRLMEFIVTKWESSYLRRPTDEELHHILTRNAACGLPGCMGSIDCTHWEWNK
eukprot:TRINITY_DN5974_c0_g1_i4.p3 TRINITY_DN5974_c0_g1~~TRINITY_DN5974_c0_g1_i4.p3  ORF type:complete len:207 (-),score=25.58 TRINITY_DN5974_c0_g1_i4:962-1582(-)